MSDSIPARPDSPACSTFAPRPAAAPLVQRVRAQAGMEAKLMMRNGEQLLLALVIPLVILIGGVQGAARLGIDLGGRAVDVLTPGVLALAVMSTAFTSLAVATGFERRYGVIKRLGATPLGREGLLLGKITALLMVQALQFGVIGATGLAMGWRPEISLIGLLATVALGTGAFASWGLALAGTLRAEATLAAANLIYLLLMAAGAVVLPTSSYGSFGTVAAWLPSGALGDAMRASLGAGEVPIAALGILLVWALCGTLITRRTFKWD